MQSRRYDFIWLILYRIMRCVDMDRSHMQKPTAALLTMTRLVPCSLQNSPPTSRGKMQKVLITTKYVNNILLAIPSLEGQYSDRQYRKFLF